MYVTGVYFVRKLCCGASNIEVVQTCRDRKLRGLEAAWTPRPETCNALYVAVQVETFTRRTSASASNGHSSDLLRR